MFFEEDVVEGVVRDRSMIKDVQGDARIISELEDVNTRTHGYLSGDFTMSNELRGTPARTLTIESASTSTASCEL